MSSLEKGLALRVFLCFFFGIFIFPVLADWTEDTQKTSYQIYQEAFDFLKQNSQLNPLLGQGRPHNFSEVKGDIGTYDYHIAKISVEFSHQLTSYLNNDFQEFVEDIAQDHLKKFFNENKVDSFHLLEMALPPLSQRINLNIDDESFGNTLKIYFKGDVYFSFIAPPLKIKNSNIVRQSISSLLISFARIVDGKKIIDPLGLFSPQSLALNSNLFPSKSLEFSFEKIYQEALDIYRNDGIGFDHKKNFWFYIDLLTEDNKIISSQISERSLSFLKIKVFKANCRNLLKTFFKRSS